MSEEIRRARAYLSRVGEPADLALWALVERLGPAEAAEAVRVGGAPLESDSPAQARRGRVSVDDDLDSAQRHGIRLLIPEDPDWPHYALSAMCRAAGLAVAAGAGGSSGSSRPAAPPLALWVKGPDDPAALAVRSVAIIGARAATDYGMRVAAELAGDLAAQGVAVVSGGAYGIDACAHRAALAAGGQTVLVSAAGLDRPYPAAHGGLYEQVARQGLLISESPPGDAPFRRRFLTRNRLIAAFGSGSVIVEAGWRSGALNTAAHARRLGRAVMAVPGPVGSAMSAGCHALLRREPSEEGSPARLVTCVADVLAEISASPAGPVSPAGPAIPTGADGAAVSVGMAEPESARSGRLREALDALSTSEGAVYDALRPRAWASEDELSVRSGVPVVGVRRALAALLVGGLAQDGPLGFRLAPASRPGAAGFEAPSPRGRGGQP